MHSAQALLAGGVERLCLIFPSEDAEHIRVQLRDLTWGEQAVVVAGGDTRHASVQAGVRWILGHAEVPLENLYIAIHDAARPFVLPEDVARVVDAAVETGAALLGQACADTVKRIEQGRVIATVPRTELFIAQTPQVFSATFLKKAYMDQTVPFTPTDDASVMEWLGVTVKIVYSTGFNGKITTSADMDVASILAERRWGRS